MTKNRLLQILFLSLIAIYISLMFVSINGVYLKNYWFSFTLFFIGMYAIIYFILYNLDSSLYYGVLLISLAIFTILKFSNSYIIKILPIYFASFALAHFANFVVFKQNIHFKLFAILFLQIILIVGYKTNFLNINLFILLTFLYILLILFSFICRLIKNLRRR